jgi:flagellin
MGFGSGLNISALRTQRQINVTTGRLNQAYERLSSGLRVNRSKDDAAGLAVAMRLRSDARVATVSSRNANDGISIIGIADSAVAQINDILIRLSELAQQSGSGVYTNEQRSSLSNEFQALMSEVERIAATTEYNGVFLLSNSDALSFQIGYDGSSLSSITYSGIQATLASMGLASVGSSVPTFSILADSELESRSAALYALDAIKGAITSITHSRGTLGAAESRLLTTMRQLATARESFQTSESAITDADVAQEAAEMARLTVLQQAGTAILANARLQPELALKLLNDS